MRKLENLSDGVLLALFIVAGWALVWVVSL